MLIRLKKKLSRKPEYSRPLRILVLAAMLVPLLALARVHSGLWPHVILAVGGICAGHWYSYRHLEQPSQLARAVMFVFIHLAFGWLFVGLLRDWPAPQAQFAIFAQAITSFDLRHRSSLYNTLIHSLAILYVAATFSRTVELGLYLLLFAGLVLALFYTGQKERGQKAATLHPEPAASPQKIGGLLPRSARSITIFSAGFGGVALVAVFVIFMLTPRFANRPLVPPFTINVPLRGGITAEIINPGLPLVQVNGWSDQVGDYFFGFDTDLDLRYRGGLSNKIVMYVRSPSRSYWRSHSYDRYDAITWSQSDRSVTQIEQSGVYFELPFPLGSPQSQRPVGELQPDGNRVWDRHSRSRHLEEVFNLADSPPADKSWRSDQQIVQTFNIVHDQPNLIFAAYRPAEIFIVSESISLDRSDGLRLPEPLKAGITYSVVSYRPDFDPERLRQASTQYPAEIAGRYLQLPDNISERVKKLAHDLTEPHNNPFDKVTALNDHLLTYPYDFFPPPHPPGAEVVDNFLFEDQRGFCEMYVTSLVVMARSLGIPARLATGYGAGDYNPVTGYYEVRFSHAHSWAEVYFPGHGWVPFDPTPGWEPQPYPTPVQNWLLADNRQLLQQLSGLNLPLGELASGGMAGLSFLASLLAASALLVGLGLLALFLSRRLRQWLKQWATRRYTPPAGGERTRRLILKTYHRAARLLVRKKYRPRQPWETAGEYARSLGQFPALTRLSQLAEIAAYRPHPPDTATANAAEEALAALKDEIRPR